MNAEAHVEGHWHSQRSRYRCLARFSTPQRTQLI